MGTPVLKHYRVINDARNAIIFTARDTAACPLQIVSRVVENRLVVFLSRNRCACSMKGREIRRYVGVIASLELFHGDHTRGPMNGYRRPTVIGCAAFYEGIVTISSSRRCVTRRD